MSKVFLDPFRSPFMANALVATVAIGAAGGAAGMHVLLRRKAFMVDALTHTAFPGAAVALAFSAPLVIGAGAACGLSAALLTSVTALHRRTYGDGERVDSDTLVAIIYTSLFAVGVIVVSRRSGYASDITALLFGRALGTAVPDLIAAACLSGLAVGTLVVFNKELVLSAFDPSAAAALGYRTHRLDLVVNLAVAVVVVAGVKTIGTLLTLSFVVVPAAIARLLTNRVATGIAMSAAVGASAGWFGLTASYHFSVRYDARVVPSAAVALTLAVAFLVALTTRALTSRRKLSV